jgi:prepilin-type N-terminal cleavage/methylation domain-containing protein
VQKPRVTIAPLSRFSRYRKGFTLVEVIVVIVIIAILAAIGVPALTGYIGKAQDKQYIADARDHFVAARAVLAEAYADEDFSNAYDQAKMDSFLSNGNAAITTTGSLGAGTKSYPLDRFGWYLVENDVAGFEDSYKYNHRVADLIGEKRRQENDYASSDWRLILAGSSSSTAINADGFMYFSYSNSNYTAIGETYIVVTYKLKNDTLNNDCTRTELGVYSYEGFTYDAGAGYEVYHVLAD